jgi:hypothetical protein
VEEIFHRKYFFQEHLQSTHISNFKQPFTIIYNGSLKKYNRGIAPDSEPMEEGSSSFENRKLNIAATVMSWLDNYGQARGYRLGSNGTSLMIQTDEISRIDSGSIDVDETYSSKSRTDFIVGPGALKQQLSLLQKACSTLLNFRNDLEPLVISNNYWQYDFGFVLFIKGQQHCTKYGKFTMFFL